MRKLQTMLSYNIQDDVYIFAIKNYNIRCISNGRVACGISNMLDFIKYIIRQTSSSYRLLPFKKTFILRV